MSWRGVAAVASRTLLLQRLWRHWFLTLLEIGFVTLCFYVMLEADIPEPRSLADLRSMESISLALGHASVRGVLYTPTTDYSDELVRRAFASIDDPYVKLRKNSVEKGRRQNKGTQAINTSAEQFKAAQRPGDFYGGKLDKFAVFEACEASTSNESRLPCILFHDASGGTSLEYSLVLFAPDIEFIPEKFPLGQMPLMKQMFFDKKILDAAFQFQQALDTAHINLQRNMTTDVPLYHVFARQLPDPLPISEAVKYRNAFYIILTLAFSAPFVLRIHEVSSELPTGLKERQTAVGLSLASFWIGHFLSAFTLAIAESACVICVMLAAEMGDTLRHYFDASEATLVLVTFLAFSTSHTLLAFLVSSAVPLAMWSETVGFLVFALLPSWEGMDFLFDSLGSYLRTSRLSKLRLCFYPNIATAMAMKVIGIFKDFSGQADWEIAVKRALDLDNVTLLEIWLAMLLGNLLTIILIWYLPQVLPWASATPQHPFFFLSPRYWIPFRVEEVKTDKNDSSCFEPEPSNLRRIIAARGITQKLGGKEVLNGINLNVYALQVMVVAGPAGAGKTTLLKILAGLQKPTKGIVEISHPSAPPDQEQRVKISMCHQGNLFFDDLTVWEHVAYFGLIRGGSVGNLRERIQDCLANTGLLDKASSFPSALTEGMKRRLSIAVAVITQPHILFLDELTTGMDTETRRNVWDIISRVCRKRTVILSSHEIAEADCLADRIIVLSQGNVVCDGTPAFLKKTFSAGFKLRVSVDRSAFPFEKLLKAVEDFAPDSFAEYYERGELTLSLETHELGVVRKTIKVLEEKASELEIASVVVSVATMKDLYKRIAERSLHEYEKVPKPNDRAIRAACAPVARCRYPEDQLCALLAKRFICLSRSGFVLFAGFLIPILVFSFAIYMASTKLFTARDKRNLKSIDLRLSTQFPDTSVFLQAEPSDFAGRFVSLLRQQGARVTVMKDAYRELRAMAQDHFEQYSKRFAFGGVFTKQEIELWYSPYSPISKAVGLNLITTALNQVYSGDASAQIHAILRTYNKSRSRDTWPTESVPELARNQLFWCLVPTAGFGFLVAVFSLQPASERLSGAKMLLCMTGVPRWLTVFADMTFDVFFYFFPMTVCLGLYVWLFGPSYTTIGALALTVASFAPAAVLFSYAIAELVSTPHCAYAICLGLFVIGAPALHVSYVLRTTVLQLGIPRVALSIFPPVALTSTMLRTVNLQVEGKACARLRFTRVGARTALHSACPNVSALGPGLQHCCEMLSESTLEKWDVLGPFSLSEKSVVMDLTIVLVEGLILFVILCAYPPQILQSRSRKTDVSECCEVDESVAEEKAVVATACAEASLSEYSLIVDGISRFYDNFAAVKAVSLAVRPGECLGLLGSSGSGKTTVLKMIAGITPVSSGECYSTIGSMSGDMHKWQSYIGICLQRGGLLVTMTARNFLTLVGRLRDIPEGQVSAAVEVMLELCDLQKQADQPCYTYTFADKRKLSIAAALITMPPIVLLDEPLNGVDTKSKEIIAYVLKRVRSFAKTAVLLATHSMEDCELTCNRVAVLSKGEIICIGTLSELKTRFSKGYTIQFVLHRVSAPDAASFKHDVKSMFPDIKLRGKVSQNTLEYYAEQRILWADWFDKMVVLENYYVLEHVYMSDTISTQLIVVLVKTKRGSFIPEDLNAEPTVL